MFIKIDEQQEVYLKVVLNGLRMPKIRETLENTFRYNEVYLSLTERLIDDIIKDNHYQDDDKKTLNEISSIFKDIVDIMENFDFKEKLEGYYLDKGFRNLSKMNNGTQKENSSANKTKETTGLYGSGRYGID